MFNPPNKNTNIDCIPEFTDSSPMLYNNVCRVISVASFNRGFKTDFPAFLKPITAGPAADNTRDIVMLVAVSFIISNGVLSSLPVIRFNPKVIVSAANDPIAAPTITVTPATLAEAGLKIKI